MSSADPGALGPRAGRRTSRLVVIAGALFVAACSAAPIGADPSKAPPSEPVTQPEPEGAIEPSFAIRAFPTSPTPPPATPVPAVTSQPPPEPAANAGPFAMNLYERGDFATQVRTTYCVPGAMQTMMNVMDAGRTRASKARQDRYYRLARRLSTDRLRGAGAEPEGWARALNRLGYGRYEVGVARTRSRAIKEAAHALRLTGRPVGLLVWRGAHAWVMTGFRATADPALTTDYRVTHVHIVDVWYPRVSSIWGPSVRPNTLVPVGKLREDYLRWRRPLMRYPEKDGRYVSVIPALEPAD